MIIVELYEYNKITSFVNYSGFTYLSRINSIDQADWWTDVFGAPDETTQERFYVGSFYRGAIDAKYDQVDSVNDCVDTEKSFYWDNDNQTIYVHFEHDRSWYTDTYSYGRAYGYTDTDVLYINDAEYLPLVRSIPSIAQQEDLQNYRSLSFIIGAIVLDNVGGLLDWVVSANIYGIDVFIYHVSDSDIVDGSVSRSDLTGLAALYIEDYDTGLDTIDIRVQDIRKSQNIDIPVDTFLTSDYPDIEEKYINKPIPLIYGDIAEHPAIPVDGLSTGNVEFRIAKSLTAIGQVQVFSSDAWSNVSTVSEDTATGSFILAYADCRSGGASNGSVLSCRVLSCSGASVTYASDVIKALNLEALLITYNSSNYDTTEWEVEEKSLSAVGVSFNKTVKLFDAIREVQSGANKGFRYEIKPDGRRTIRVDDRERDQAYIAYQSEIKNIDTLKVESNSDLLCATALVLYKKNYESGDFRIYKDASSLEDVKNNYRQAPSVEFETLLQTEALADDRAEYSLERFSVIPKILNVTLLGDRWYNLRIYDIVKIAITDGEVDFDNGEITGREFFNIWRAQVLSVDPVFNEISNRVKLVLTGRVYPVWEILLDQEDVYEVLLDQEDIYEIVIGV